jgi:peptide/nickel transport system substrate-binding protein
VLVTAACAGESRRDQNELATLTVHVPDGDERVLGPLGSRQWFLVFLGLTVDLDGTENHQPRLLERWEHSADFRDWTLHLREDVRWEDGAPVTAEDVEFSLELWTHNEILYQSPTIEEMSVLDRHTLGVRFKESAGSALFAFSWLPVVPKHLMDSLDIAEFFSWPFWVEPVGNGPYRYVRHVPKTATELEANPDYFGDPPGIPRVVLRYGGNSLTELLSGNVDIADGLTPLDVVRLEEDERFRVYHKIQHHQGVAIVWNHRNPMFADADVRRALTLAIDRRELLRVIGYPEGVPIFDVPVLTRHVRAGVVPDPLPFDSEAAAELLTRAGWVDADGDGVRERNGEEFRFTLAITANESTHATYVQDRLRRVGVRMEIATHERNVLMGSIRQSLDFDAIIDWYSYVRRFGSSPATGYSNPEVPRLVDLAISTVLDHAPHDGYMRDLWEVIGNEIPITYLHPRIRYSAAHRKVRGLENERLLYSTIEDLWIDEGETGGRD